VLKTPWCGYSGDWIIDGFLVSVRGGSDGCDLLWKRGYHPKENCVSSWGAGTPPALWECSELEPRQLIHVVYAAGLRKNRKCLLEISVEN